MTLRFHIVLGGLMFTALSSNLYAGSIPSAPPPKLHSAAVLVKDQRSGEFLMAKRADVAMPIASITKLMTAMVILDAHLNMEEILTIQEADKDILRNSHSRLPVGTRLSRREALLVSLMASENRAARALGRTFPGGTIALVRAMNEKARSFRLSETRFEDPAGLSDGNISSAKDLSRLVEKACTYALIREYSIRAEVTLRREPKELHFSNTNALVHNPRWQIGLSKTGYIGVAGRCLVMQTQLAQRPVLMVLLNSNGKDTRLGDANRIRQWLEGPKSRRKARS